MGERKWGEEHFRIHLLLDNSQEALSPTLESCEVCCSAPTPPGNWKKRGMEGGRGENVQVKEGDMDGVNRKKKFGKGGEEEGMHETGFFFIRKWKQRRDTLLLPVFLSLV